MRVIKVRQSLVSSPIPDVPLAVRTELDTLGEPPQGPVAITVGSRGVDNLVAITKTAAAWLAEHGAEPFVVPCMGSHNGATAEGQREMLAALGVTEQSVGVPVRSSMECVKVGSVPQGDVWMGRHCHEANGVLVVNRIKLHTTFGGPLQSGLVKMMVVGMGKVRSAETFHAAPVHALSDTLAEMGRVVIGSDKVWAGLGLLEDGYDHTAEVHAIRGSEILDREPALLEKHRTYFPRLPLDDINVLVVDQIGKVYSGTGMDPNVIGRRGVRGHEDLATPRVRAIAALSLAEQSLGNAVGVGLADFITRRLRAAIDEQKTFINAFTAGLMERIKVPATLADDQEMVSKLSQRFGAHRWVFIPNTLRLGEFWVSEDLADELSAIEGCTTQGTPQELTFRDGRHTLAFSNDA